MPSQLARWWAHVCRTRRMPKVVIYAPDYTYLSSGVRCLHLLCDRLNRLHIRAAVTAGIGNLDLLTPRADLGAIAAHPDCLDRSIVIYPEVVAGNPLRARNVVRYFLNAPGFFNGTRTDAHGAGDYYLHFADEFRPPDVRSRLLRLPLVDTKVFRPRPQSAGRSGFLVYSARYRPDVGALPGWIDGVTLISSAAPRDPPALAQLYRSSRALIVGERTAAIAEALHCHCPVMILPHPGFSYEPVLKSYADCGVALGLDPAGLARVAASAPGYASRYARLSADADARIVEFVNDAARHFGLPALA